MLAYTCALVERARAELVLVMGDRKGVTALEYGIIAAVTVAAVGGVIVAVGKNLTTLWTTISTDLATAAG